MNTLEQIFVAHWANYRWRDFQKLDGDFQAELVAAFRAHNQIEAVMAHEQNKKMKRR